MPKIKILTEGVEEVASQINTIKHRTSDSASKYQIVKRNLDWQVQARRNISGELSNLQRRMNRQEDKLNSYQRVLIRAVSEFHEQDQKIKNDTKKLLYTMRLCKAMEMHFVGPNSNNPHNWHLNILSIYNSLFGVTNTIVPLGLIQLATQFALNSNGTIDSEPSMFAKFINNDLKIEKDIIHEKLDGKQNWFGIDIEGNLEGGFLHGEAGIKNSASFKLYDDGEFNPAFEFVTAASIAGALAFGEASGNIGYLHGKVAGEFMTGGVSGEAKATLYEDGGFNPSLQIGAKAEASVASGEAEAGLGTDQYGIYANASGDVLHAEAEAKVGAGYLGTDEDGNKEYGVVAKAEAMACAAEGEVEAGFTIFGIDVDIGVKGYAGAAGVEAGAEFTSDGVSLDAGIAAVVGPGVSIDIDWSDAKWIGETADAIGDFAEGAYEVTTDFFDNVGNFISSGFDWF